MKKSKKNSLIGVICLCGTLGASTLTLTSCGKVSQWYLPVVSGGSSNENGPFHSSFKNSEGKYKDVDGGILSYIQSNYSYYIDPSSSGSSATSVYSFADPHDFSKEYKSTDTIDTYSKQWLSGSDKKLSTVLYKTKDGDTTTNHFDQRNWNMLTTAQAINSITSNVSQLISYMLYYELHLVNSYIADSDQTKLNQLFGDEINFGSKGDASFNDFFEFNFNLANLMSDSGSHVKFGQSSCNIDITSHLNNKDNALGFLTYEGSESETDGMLNPDYAYVDKTDQDTSVEPAKTIVKSYHSIPFIFDVDNLSFSYYDPLTSNKSFLPQSWLIDNEGIVNKKIKSSSAWNKYEKVTGQPKQISSLTWDVELNNTNTQGLNLSQFVQKEPTLKNINNIKPSSFIGLASYFVEEVTPNEGDDKTIIRTPEFSQVLGIYPAYFLQDDAVFNQKDDDHPDIYLLNKQKLDDKMKDLVTFLTERNSKPDDPRNGVKYFFSSYNDSKWTADASKIFVKQK